MKKQTALGSLASLVILMSSQPFLASSDSPPQAGQVVNTGLYYESFLVTSNDPISFLFRLTPVPSKAEGDQSISGEMDVKIVIGDDCKAQEVELMGSSGNEQVDKEITGAVAKSCYKTKDDTRASRSTTAATLSIHYSIKFGQYWWSKDSEAIYSVCMMGKCTDHGID